MGIYRYWILGCDNNSWQRSSHCLNLEIILSGWLDQSQSKDGFSTSSADTTEFSGTDTDSAPTSTSSPEQAERKERKVEKERKGRKVDRKHSRASSLDRREIFHKYIPGGNQHAQTIKPFQVKSFISTTNIFKSSFYLLFTIYLSIYLSIQQKVKNLIKISIFIIS